MLPPGGPHSAAHRLHLHDRQHTALLPGWATTGIQKHLHGGLAHGGPHRRGPLCEYKPTICVQTQKPGLGGLVVDADLLFLINSIVKSFLEFPRSDVFAGCFSHEFPVLRLLTTLSNIADAVPELLRHQGRGQGLLRDGLLWESLQGEWSPQG